MQSDQRARLVEDTGQSDDASPPFPLRLAGPWGAGRARAGVSHRTVFTLTCDPHLSFEVTAMKTLPVKLVSASKPSFLFFVNENKLDYMK